MITECENIDIPRSAYFLMPSLIVFEKALKKVISKPFTDEKSSVILCKRRISNTPPTFWSTTNDRPFHPTTPHRPLQRD